MFLGEQPWARPKSPVAEQQGQKYPKMKPNGLQSGMIKINRIPLKRTALVNIINAESPSAIWVRLENHITDQLVLHPYQDHHIERVNPCEVQEMNYYMAPTELGIGASDAELPYGRVRLLKIVKNTADVSEDDEGFTDCNDKCLVFYIDEGRSEWVSIKCLASMEDSDLMYHPWQAIHIALAGLAAPAVDMDVNQDWMGADRAWTEEECDAFRETLTMIDFARFKTQTLFSSVNVNDAREAIMVKLFGMRSMTDEVGVAIDALFAAHLRSRILPRYVRDAPYELIQHHDFIKTAGEIQIAEHVRNFPSHSGFAWKIVPQSGSSSNLEEEFGVPVPRIDESWLRQHFLDDVTGEILISVEGARTVSPYEWYARPVKRGRIGTRGDTLLDKTDMTGLELSKEELQYQPENETDTIINANDLLQEKANILDSFYSLESNRRSFGKQEIKKELDRDHEVYAICATSSERARYTGEWQRVQVVSLTVKEFADVRFLDSGGRETVLPSCLYYIHKEHAKYPPLCAQFCLQGIAPVDQGTVVEWSQESRRIFSQLLRQDVLLSISLDLCKRLLSSKPSGREAWSAPHVFFVQKVAVFAESDPISMSMVQGGHAIEEPDKPVPWDY